MISRAHGVLDGLVVVALVENLPGPLATVHLAELGADVILVERPGGDPAREVPGQFEAFARGKRSVCADLKSDLGLTLVRRMVARADVVVESFRPGLLSRWGLDARTLRGARPELIYVSISGFGQTGPYAGRPTHDLVAEAPVGMLGITESTYPSLPFADIAVASTVVSGVLAAVIQRSRTGDGATLDAAMADSLLGWMAPLVVPAANGLPLPSDLHAPGYGRYVCGDGLEIALGVMKEQRLWDDLCRALDRPSLVGVDWESRRRDAGRIEAELSRAVASRPSSEWSVVLGAADVAFAVVRGVRDVVDDPQVQARGHVLSADSGHVALRTPLARMLDDGAAPAALGPVPALGEHTAEVARSLGFAGADLDTLVATATR